MEVGFTSRPRVRPVATLVNKWSVWGGEKDIAGIIWLGAMQDAKSGGRERESSDGFEDSVAEDDAPMASFTPCAMRRPRGLSVGSSDSPLGSIGRPNLPNLCSARSISKSI